MCCEPKGRGTHGFHGHGAHGDHSGHGGSCCCCDAHGFARNFVTRAERLAALEGYRDELAKELDGVNERISELAVS